MSLTDGRGLMTWEGGLFDPADARSADLLARLQWAFAEIRRRGGTISLTEAGRPVGVRSDMFVRNAWQTASGVSTMWFQWGRKQRGETPSAINPATSLSKHTTGTAADVSSPTAYDVRIRNEVFALVGIIQTIPDLETWHYELLYPNRGRDLLAGTASAGTVRPIPPRDTTTPLEENNMHAYRIINQDGGLNGVGFLVGDGGAFYGCRALKGETPEVEKFGMWLNRTGEPFAVTEADAEMILGAHGVPWKQADGRLTVTMYGYNGSYAKQTATGSFF